MPLSQQRSNRFPRVLLEGHHLLLGIQSFLHLRRLQLGRELKAKASFPTPKQESEGGEIWKFLVSLSAMDRRHLRAAFFFFFFLALVFAKRISELHGLLYQVKDSRGWRSCNFSFFTRICGQDPSVSNPRFEELAIPSLYNFVHGNWEEMLLCPARALQKYLSKLNSTIQLVLIFSSQHLKEMGVLKYHFILNWRLSGMPMGLFLRVIVMQLTQSPWGMKDWLISSLWCSG